MIWRRIAIGTSLSGAIGALAWWRKLLTLSGAVGTVLIGAVIYSAGGLGWSLVIIVFFVSSSVLSRLYSNEKRRVASDKFGKPSARDGMQALANGGVAALAAALYGRHPRHPTWLRSAFVGALATATADTWATEIGTLSRSQPRLITTGCRVPPGTSGGVTLRGTAAAAAGGLALGIVAALATREPSQEKHTSTRLIAAGFCAGLAGALCDSLLGATVQRVSYCPVCESETERAIHSCGTQTQPLRGLAWMDNDVVNLLSTAFGAAIAVGVTDGLSRLA